MNLLSSPLKLHSFMGDEIYQSIQKLVNNLKNNPYALHPHAKLSKMVFEEREQFSVYAQQAVDNLSQVHKDSLNSEWLTLFQRDGIEIQEHIDPSHRGVMRCKCSIQVRYLNTEIIVLFYYKHFPGLTSSAAENSDGPAAGLRCLPRP